MKRIGMGTMARATNPRREDAQRGPRATYIFRANSGKPAPKILRTTVLAESADAAFWRYESMK